MSHFDELYKDNPNNIGEADWKREAQRLQKELDRAKMLLADIGDELPLLRYVSGGAEPHTVRRRIIDFLIPKE